MKGIKCELNSKHESAILNFGKCDLIGLLINRHFPVSVSFVWIRLQAMGLTPEPLQLAPSIHFVLISAV